MKLSGNKILITGGATGIGFALAERFIKENNEVIICGRRADALQDAAGKLSGLITIQCDVATPGGREELFGWIKENHSDLNVLVNNAGIQNWMQVTDADFFDRARHEIAVNVEGPVHLSALFIQLKKLSTIINVTSGLAFTPLVKTPVYSGTKAFMRSFTLSLRQLLSGSNIEVIEMIPPALNTDLGGKGLHDFAPPVSAFIETIFEQLKEGKTELTFGFSEAMLKAGPDELKQAFNRMNGGS